MKYYSGKIGNDATLRLSPLSNAQAQAFAPEYEGSPGYFLYRIYESDPHAVEILARVDTDDAAFQLSRLLGLE